MIDQACLGSNEIYIDQPYVVAFLVRTLRVSARVSTRVSLMVKDIETQHSRFLQNLEHELDQFEGSESENEEPNNDASETAKGRGKRGAKRKWNVYEGKKRCKEV